MGEVMTELGQNPQAAWYVDPSSPDQIRFWDGEKWTEHVAPLDTVADLHTGHFESIRTDGRRSLGLADRAARPTRQPSARGDHPVDGAHFDIDPPELGKGWFVAEGLTLQPDAIRTEHVVVGAPGVFVLMSRDHHDSEVWVADRSFLVNGQSTDYLRQAANTAHAVTRMLREQCGFTVGVEPVIIVKAKELTIKSRPLDAHVVSSSLLGKWLIRLEPILLPSAVREISDAIGAQTPDTDYPPIDDDVIDLRGDEAKEPRTFAPTPEQPSRATRKSLFS